MAGYIKLIKNYFQTFLNDLRKKKILGFYFYKGTLLIFLPDLKIFIFFLRSILKSMFLMILLEKSY
jgi:hypothetical protein